MIDNQEGSTVNDESVTPTTDESVEIIESQDTTSDEDSKLDNIDNLREEYKALKKDASTYKSSHEFITSSFGDTATAEQARDFFNNFTGTEFNEEQFIDYIRTLSPQRTDKLVEKLASERAKAIADSQVNELFGGVVTPDEIKLFKDFKESGYGLANVDDIPEELKYNDDGTPKSDKEIEYLRGLHKRVKAVEENEQNRTKELDNVKRVEQETVIQTKINQFADDRLKIVLDEIETIGLAPVATDTSQQRQEKEQAREFILNGISAMFMRDAKANEDYNSAVEHIRNGEPLLARRYEARIESKLLEFLRSDYVGKMISVFTNKSTTPNPEPRPEISNTRSAGEPNDKTKRVTANDIFSSLVAKGAIKVD